MIRKGLVLLVISTSLGVSAKTVMFTGQMLKRNKADVSQLNSNDLILQNSKEDVDAKTEGGIGLLKNGVQIWAGEVNNNKYENPFSIKEFNVDEVNIDESAKKVVLIDKNENTSYTLDLISLNRAKNGAILNMNANKSNKNTFNLLTMSQFDGWSNTTLLKAKEILSDGVTVSEYKQTEEMVSIMCEQQSAKTICRTTALKRFTFNLTQ